MNIKKTTFVAGAVALVSLAIVILLASRPLGCASAPGSAGQIARAAAETPATPPAPFSVSAQAAGQMTLYNARPGSTMRIEGTANIIHPTWQIEGKIIGGMIEVGPGFPTEPGQAATPGKVEAKADVFIPVRSLKSVEPDGSHYSDRMDEVMLEHLKEEQYKQIRYQLTELTLKEAPKTKDAPYVFDAKGNLNICGVTNQTTMVVNILPRADKKLEITGRTAVKMTDYKVAPVDINLVLGHIKTGDEVKLIFKWIVGLPKAAAATAK